MAQLSDVLVVDDDAHIREFVKLALSGEGYEVVGVPDGAAALTLLEQRQQDGQRLPAVILLDMQMPVMTGWEFASAYHQRPGPHVPLVVMTAAVDATSRALQIGAADVLGKPFGLRALLECVGRYVEDARRAVE